MKVHGGRSGASFRVVKRGDNPAVVGRLWSQWEWLKIPRGRTAQVFDWVGDGYELELLVPSDANLCDRLQHVGTILRDEVWIDPAPSINWRNHLDTVAARGAPLWLTALGKRLGPTSESCDAHGDATAENLMQRPDTDDHVLIDPVPDASCGTGERGADLGKMLTSAIGYERLRTDGTDLALDVDAVAVVRGFARTAVEWMRARYWCGVWLSMNQRYAEPHAAERLAAGTEALRDFIEGRPAAFLDRDGTLNRTVGGIPPRGDDPVQLIEGAADACRLLREAGYLLVVVSNQPEVARGTLSVEEVQRVNRVVSEAAGLDAIMLCPHERDTCSCRKPQPGLIDAAARHFDVDLTRSWLVGDKLTDMGAAQAAGIPGYLLPPDTDGELLRIVRRQLAAVSG